MIKRRVYIMAIIAAALVVGILWIAFCGYQWSWGPFAGLHDFKTAKLPGNAPQYDPQNIQQLPESTLAGKHIIFLGSSVTYGASAQGVSFADDIGARNGCFITKEAVSGTTLVDNGPNSYISRLKKLNTAQAADLFICQLSTNDATQKKPLGSVSDSFQAEGFDTGTVAGAIEYIIAYARKVWSCPVMFYTNPRYDSNEYANMVALLYAIQEKWDIFVIDLWGDAKFNAITEKQQSLYMADAIHPTKAGYLEWWTPYMEGAIYEAVVQ